MHKFQYLYFNKIIAVIRSCKDEVQLDNARKWFDRVTYINKLPVELTNKIVRAYKAKKQQIQRACEKKSVNLVFYDYIFTYPAL